MAAEAVDAAAIEGGDAPAATASRPCAVCAEPAIRLSGKDIMQSSILVVQEESRPAMAAPMDPEVFLSKFSAKDQKGIARHLITCEEKWGAAASERWSRFAHILMALAPHPAKLGAQQAIQFYVPDGKYKMQVFALQVLDEGVLAVYTGNILEQALHAGILVGPMSAEGGTIYRIGQSPESLAIDALDWQTFNLAPVCKGLTGWHRKAMCIALPPNASPVQLAAVERLCALAAQQWSEAA